MKCSTFNHRTEGRSSNFVTVWSISVLLGATRRENSILKIRRWALTMKLDCKNASILKPTIRYVEFYPLSGYLIYTVY